MNNTPLVTVLLITYNHVDYFEKAIQSVLAQKTNFPFQIIISDDASTDGTSEIVKKYKDIPNVKVIIRKENSCGKNTYLTLSEINTKYFTVLEADDYWCDENKLQTQVDILENNPDCSFCAHNTLVNYPNLKTEKEYLRCPTKIFKFPKKLTKRYFIEPHTSSRLYRSECLKLDEIKNPLIATYDIAINFYYLTKGNLYYIDKIMSVYNYTNRGVYSSASSYLQRFKSASVIKQINEEFDYKYNNLLSRFFSTRLNLNFFSYLLLKYSTNKDFLSSFYDKILKAYERNYLCDWEQKPIMKISVPFGSKKRVVFELRREKNRV